jgi:hypothetical protein
MCDRESGEHWYITWDRHKYPRYFNTFIPRIGGGVVVNKYQTECANMFNEDWATHVSSKEYSRVSPRFQEILNRTRLKANTRNLHTMELAGMDDIVYESLSDVHMFQRCADGCVWSMVHDASKPFQDFLEKSRILAMKHGMAAWKMSWLYATVWSTPEEQSAFYRGCIAREVAPERVRLMRVRKAFATMKETETEAGDEVGELPSMDAGSARSKKPRRRAGKKKQAKRELAETRLQSNTVGSSLSQLEPIYEQTHREPEEEEEAPEMIPDQDVIELSHLLNAALTTPREDDTATSVATALACVVCFSNEKSVAMIPCGHRCVCTTCADRVREEGKCPMCRSSIQGVMRVFD